MLLQGSPKGSIASRISRLKLDGPRADKPIESISTLRSVKDIDAGDHKDQMANAEYANDVYRNLWKHEVLRHGSGLFRDEIV